MGDESMIACLGWGSLIWDPRELPIQGKWFDDGPMLQVEFVRQSADGRLTLVLLPTGTTVRSLWTLFSSEGVTQARNALGKREGVSNFEKYIATWRIDDKDDSNPAAIGNWVKKMGLEAAVWTALPPRFKGEDYRVPTVEEAVQYLRDLPFEQYKNAERYIRLAPRQIDTAYRRRFERDLGWAPATTM